MMLPLCSPFDQAASRGDVTGMCDAILEELSVPQEAHSRRSIRVPPIRLVSAAQEPVRVFVGAGQRNKATA